MLEQREPVLDLKDRTLQIANESNLNEVIDVVSNKFGLNDFEQKSMIPISTDLIEEGRYSIEVSEDVKKQFNTYVELINESDTAFEYPFLVTGKITEQGEIATNNIKQLNTSSETLSNTEIKMSSYSKLLIQGINEAKERGENVYILGHTHPVPNLSAKQNSFIERMESETKDKYHIKELGLNLSLSDLYQLVYFEKGMQGIAPVDSKIFLSVLMFDGSVHFVYVEDGIFKKLKIKD